MALRRKWYAAHGKRMHLAFGIRCGIDCSTLDLGHTAIAPRKSIQKRILLLLCAGIAITTTA